MRCILFAPVTEWLTMGRLRSSQVLVRFLVPLALGSVAACGGKDSRPTESAPQVSDGGGASGAAGESFAGTAGALTTAGTAGTGGDGGSQGIAGAANPAGSAGAAPIEGSAGSAGSSGAAGTAGTAGTVPELARECAQDVDCAAVEICVQMPGAAASTCRPRCSPNDVGEQGSCRDGEICSLDASGAAASCQQICDPSDPELAACPSLDICYVDPSPILTADVAVPGLCVRGGSLEIGTRCEEGWCRAELVCLTTLDGAGIGYCAARCDPTAAEGEDGACPEGHECELGITGQTGCVQRCAPMSAGECGDSLMCSALVGKTDASEDGGRCVAPGSSDLDAPCEPGDCVEGLLCAGWPTPLATGERICSELCSPVAPESCFNGTCVPLDADSSDVGTCQRTCEPLGVGVAAGCNEGEWCAPSTTLRDVGICVPDSGAAAAGEVCASQSDCIGGSYCECPFGPDAFCTTEASCQPICIPGQDSDAPGGCPTGESCAILSDAGRRYPFGVCRVECDANASDDPCGDDETCISATLAGGDADVCADIPLPLPAVGEYCPAPQFNVGEPCGVASLCVPWEDLELPRCSEICRFAEGAEGSSGHPDCADPGAACTAIAGESEFGYCRTE